MTKMLRWQSAWLAIPLLLGPWLTLNRALAGDASAPTPEGGEAPSTASSAASVPQDISAAPEDWALHGQSTFTDRSTSPAFRASYSRRAEPGPRQPRA